MRNCRKTLRIMEVASAMDCFPLSFEIRLVTRSGTESKPTVYHQSFLCVITLLRRGINSRPLVVSAVNNSRMLLGHDACAYGEVCPAPGLRMPDCMPDAGSGGQTDRSHPWIRGSGPAVGAKLPSGRKQPTSGCVRGRKKPICFPVPTRAAPSGIPGRVPDRNVDI